MAKRSSFIKGERGQGKQTYMNFKFPGVMTSSISPYKLLKLRSLSKITRKT